MKQYEYQIRHKRTGRIEYARATALNAVIAHAHIALEYGQQYDINELYSDINPPHQIAGEIDCTGFPESDTNWIIEQANKAQGQTL